MKRDGEGRCDYCNGLLKELAECGCGGSKVDEISFRSTEAPQPLVVEKDIPLPEVKPRLADIIATMDIGDSMFIPAKDPSSFKHSFVKLRKEGWRFTQRKIDGGYRVWRIDDEA